MNDTRLACSSTERRRVAVKARTRVCVHVAQASPVVQVALQRQARQCKVHAQLFEHRARLVVKGGT